MFNLRLFWLTAEGLIPLIMGLGIEKPLHRNGRRGCFRVVKSVNLAPFRFHDLSISETIDTLAEFGIEAPIDFDDCLKDLMFLNDGEVSFGSGKRNPIQEVPLLHLLHSIIPFFFYMVFVKINAPFVENL